VGEFVSAGDVINRAAEIVGGAGFIRREDAYAVVGHYARVELKQADGRPRVEAERGVQGHGDHVEGVLDEAHHFDAGLGRVAEDVFHDPPAKSQPLEGRIDADGPDSCSVVRTEYEVGAGELAVNDCGGTVNCFIADHAADDSLSHLD
jgi:hypothetical protein